MPEEDGIIRITKAGPADPCPTPDPQGFLCKIKALGRLPWTLPWSSKNCFNVFLAALKELACILEVASQIVLLPGLEPMHSGECMENEGVHERGLLAQKLPLIQGCLISFSWIACLACNIPIDGDGF